MHYASQSLSRTASAQLRAEIAREWVPWDPYWIGYLDMPHPQAWTLSLWLLAQPRTTYPVLDGLPADPWIRPLNDSHGRIIWAAGSSEHLIDCTDPTATLTYDGTLWHPSPAWYPVLADRIQHCLHTDTWAEPPVLWPRRLGGGLTLETVIVIPPHHHSNS